MLSASLSFGRKAAVFLLCGCLLPCSSRAQTRQASIEIDASKRQGAISPEFYGQFIEIMFGGVDGLWAELIRNRSFEEPSNAIGLSRFWEREPDDRNHDPSMQMHWDDSVTYAGTGRFSTERATHSLRVEISRDQWDIRQRRGISQGKIPIHAGAEYRGYFWLKSAGFNGHVRVALEQDRTDPKTYAFADLPVNDSAWTRYEFSLRSAVEDPLAKFSILFRGTGRLWLDQVSLMPADSVQGVRPDFLAKAKALHPSFLRWPGGNVAQEYHWMWGVGPRDQRTAWTNTAWWNELEISDFGTDEFIQLCHEVGAEPSLTVNVEGRGATAEEAAAWVGYVNGPATSEYGRMRAANGHPEPYGVKYWEVGNEIWGEWERGHTDAETYARNFNRYVAAMKAVDPTIRVIAAGDTKMAWNSTLLEIAGAQIDYLAIHHYYGLKDMQGDQLNLLAHPLAIGQLYVELRKLIQEKAPGRNIKLTINEWNTSLPVPMQHTMWSALYAGRLLNVFERNADIIRSTAVSDLVNGWSGGIIQTSRHGIFVTPTFLVNKLYAEHLGAQRVAIRVDGPTFDSSLEGKDVPYLDAVASLSDDGEKVYIKGVNADAMNNLVVNVRIAGSTVEPTGDMQYITGDLPDEANSFSAPDAVSVRTYTIKTGATFTVELPKHSVSVITLRKKR